MNSKRRHIWFGILGIYIFLLTCFMLFAGVYQFINTIQHYIEMQIIGPDRLDWGAYIWYLLVRFASFISVPIIELVIGGLGVSCLIITPTAKQFRTLGYLFCVLAILMIIRGCISLVINFSTFKDIFRAIFFFIFAKKWEIYQQNEFSNRENIKREYFPFVQVIKKAMRI